MAGVGRNAASVAHLNMAGAGRVSDAVLSRISAYQALEREVGPYEAEEFHRDLLEARVYDRLARLLNCEAAEIALFDSATRAWLEIARRLRLDGAGILVTTPYEYAGNLQILRMLADRHGHTIVTVPLAGDGDLDLDWLRAEMSDRVRLVSLVHVPSNCGIVNPAEAVGEIVAPYPAVYIVDACQSVGQREIDVRRIGCDVLTGAGRKFISGPRGTGFAYVAAGMRERMRQGFVDLHRSRFRSGGAFEVDLATARALETAERDCAAIAGLELAVAEAAEAVPASTCSNFDALRRSIGAMPGVEAIDPGRERGHIFTFRHRDVGPADVVHRLRGDGVRAWRIQGSHTPLFMLPRGLHEAVRLSSSRLSCAEAEHAIGATARALRG